MVGAWRGDFGQAHQALAVGFFSFWYSVVYNVESLSLFYLLFIYLFVCMYLGVTSVISFLYIYLYVCTWGSPVLSPFIYLFVCMYLGSPVLSPFYTFICMYVLGADTNQTAMCLDPYQN